MLEFQPCERLESDARTILEWRNDPVTLSMFYHRTPKVWESFWSEFKEKYFLHPNLPCGFAVERGSNERVAFLKFSPCDHPIFQNERCVDISINVSPYQRGKGWGAESLRLAQRVIFDRGFDAIVAEIRKENAASIASFGSAGFKFLDEMNKHIEDTGETCRIVRYLSERRGRKAVLFDLDGTLADSLHTMRKAYDQFLGHYGRRGSDEEFNSLVGPPLDEVVRILSEKHRLPGDASSHYDTFVRLASGIYEREVTLMPKVREVLGTLRKSGFQLGIVTSNSRRLIKPWIQAVELERAVDLVITAEDVKKGKPHPDPYLLAIQRLHAEVSLSFAIEDSEMGVRSSRAAGLRTFVFSSHKVKREWNGVEQTFFHYDELADLISLTSP